MQGRFRLRVDDELSENQVSLMCNCGEEIIVVVDPDAENEVTCAKCGQQYRFFGRSVLR